MFNSVEEVMKLTPQEFKDALHQFGQHLQETQKKYDELPRKFQDLESAMIAYKEALSRIPSCNFISDEDCEETIEIEEESIEDEEEYFTSYEQALFL